MQISDLLLTECVAKAISEFGFTTLTPVQAATIPQFLNHKDVIVEAVTGSGKTIAFVIPLVEILLRKTDKWKMQEIGAVILSPTRELALQISQVLERVIKYTSLTCSSWIGGRSAVKDVEEFNCVGGQIIVATPGRFLDLLENHASKSRHDLRVSLKSLEVLVLDEADRLLEMGFEATLSSIMSYLPKQRRTGMFSATQTTELKQLIRVGMRNPVVIKVQEKLNLRTPTGLTSFYTIQKPEKKLDHFVRFLRAHQKQKHLVFFSTCDSVNYFSAFLSAVFKKWTVLCLHRKLKHKRQSIFNQFSALSSGILVCTDVVARGIDWPDIDWVVQMDVPKSAAVYVHRCGRTARMGGRVGKSLLYLMPNEDSYVDFIRRNQQVELSLFDEKQLEGVDSFPDGCSQKLRKFAEKDKKVYDESIRAFVSYVRAYGQHECSLICRTKDLDLGALAEGFALLKLPKMPELRDFDTSSFKETDIDPKNIPYKDKQREKQRKLNAEKPESDRKLKSRRPSMEAFSIAKAKRLESKERKLVKEIRKKQKSEDYDKKELDELASDMRLIKKLRLKKISRQKFNDRFARGSSNSDLSESEITNSTS